MATCAQKAGLARKLFLPQEADALHSCIQSLAHGEMHLRPTLSTPQVLG